MTDMPTNREQWNTVWSHFNRLQKRVMATHTSKEEFFAESPEKRWDFYCWICKQVPNAAWI